jgi:hypothetical protein
MQLNEELGEIICPECKGLTATEQGMYMLRCPKCQGAGKLDWCQQAVGVPPPKYYSMDSSAVMSFNQPFASCNISCAVQSLADHIDHQIVSCCRVYPEHNDKEDARRYMYDN